ncbi:LysR substrate-binding domain-containing protein, partial [Escherichia coli]|nr:LysR substrate-binding domain-containing protein [Escherichia coli]
DYKLNTLHSMNEDAGVVGMVRAKLGIAFVSSHANLDFEDIRVIELSDLYISYNVYMIWQPSEFLPNSLKSFKNFILKQTQ